MWLEPDNDPASFLVKKHSLYIAEKPAHDERRQPIQGRAAAIGTMEYAPDKKYGFPAPFTMWDILSREKKQFGLFQTAYHMW